MYCIDCAAERPTSYPSAAAIRRRDAERIRAALIAEAEAKIRTTHARWARGDCPWARTSAEMRASDRADAEVLAADCAEHGIDAAAALEELRERIMEVVNPRADRAAHLVRGTVQPVVGDSELTK